MRTAGKRGTIKYSFAEICAGAVRDMLCTLLLVQSVCFMCRDFLGWEIPLSINIRMQLLLLMVAAMYEFTPLCQKYRPYVGILIEVASFLGMGLYLYENYEILESGQKALSSDYIRHWNRYYGTNYTGYGSSEYLVVFLSALVFAIFLFALVFRYITGVRRFLLVPVIAALTPGLLVNVYPNWQSLCLFFLGTLLLYCGPEKKTKIAFCKIDNGKGGFKHKATCFAVPFVVLVLSTGILFLSSALFSKAADRIIEHNKEFLKIQKALEDRIKDLGKSGISFALDWSHVDNQTPEYSGKRVLSIYASARPKSNLYLKDFHSGTYAGGTWQSEGEEFEKAAKQAGIGEDFEMFLYRMYPDILERNEEEADQADYRIDYDTVFSNAALVPYFMDLSEAGKDVWVEHEGLVQKRRGVKSLTIRGMLENQVSVPPYELEEGSSRKWYEDYVSTQYQTGAENIPALEDCVEEIETLYGTYFYKVTDSDSWAIYYENMKRMQYAERVRDLLDEIADYNLYLDEIPDNTDTIQYFLETGHEGYCMHFASAGTLLLQELGIPARYASGYVVKAWAFKHDGSGYHVEILDRNAHAWTEIYLEGIGWIPFEMTPGYQSGPGGKLPTDEDCQDELREQHQKKQQSAAHSYSEQETETETETETEPEIKETESESGQEKTDSDKNKDNTRSDGDKATRKYVLVCLFIIFVLLVVLAGGFYGFSQKDKKILAEELKNERNRRAVKRINHRIYKALWTVRALTDEEYLERLIQKYPEVSADEWKNYMQIVQKAVFSKEEITKEEAAFCYKCYKMRKKK